MPEFITLADGSLAVKGRNLWAVCNEIPGFLSDEHGIIVAPNPCRKECTTEYIPVATGQTLVVQGWVTLDVVGEQDEYPWRGWLFFDENKVPLGNRPGFRIPYDGEAGETVKHWAHVVVIPDSARYVRFSARRYEDGKFMVQYGSGLAPFVSAPEDEEAV